MVPSHPCGEQGTPTLGAPLPLAQTVKGTQKHRLFPAPPVGSQDAGGNLPARSVLSLLFSFGYQQPQPPVSNSAAGVWVVVDYVPPPGPKSKSLYLVGEPQSIFVNSRLMEGRGL